MGSWAGFSAAQKGQNKCKNPWGQGSSQPFSCQHAPLCPQRGLTEQLLKVIIFSLGKHSGTICNCFLEPALGHKLPKAGEVLGELLSWEVSGLCLEARGFGLGAAPAPGWDGDSLFMIKWEANLLIYWQQAAQTADAFQQSCAPRRARQKRPPGPL